MNAAEVLCLARENGIHFSVLGTDLILDAEREPAPDLLVDIKRHKVGIVALLSHDRNAWTAEEWRTFFDERASIAEFDGGQNREAAAATAFECCIIEWLNCHPCRSNLDHCAMCGKPVKLPCYGPFFERVSGTGGRMLSA